MVTRDNMAASRSSSVLLWENMKEDEGRNRTAMFDVFPGTVRQKIVLQRLMVIGRLPHDVADRTELGDHYERLNFQLSKQHIWDHTTGLLLIYPACVLHVIESSRDVLLSVLKDLRDMQLQTDGSLLETAKVVSMAHVPHSRMFQQWSYKVLDADHVAGDPVKKGSEEEDESTETLVCSLMSALQNLGKHLETSQKTLPGSVLDGAPEQLVSQDVLRKLLSRDELPSPQLHLQMYDSPLTISMGFGQVNRSSCLTTV